MRLALFLRKRAPQSLRSLYRAVRSLKPVQESGDVPPELVRDCRFIASREDLLTELPPRGRVAELGTDTGEFAARILERCDPQQLHLIDLDMSRLDRRVRQDSR